TGGLLDRRGPAEHDKVGNRHLLAAGASVEVAFDVLVRLEDSTELLGLIHLPVALRVEANSAAIGAAAMVRSAIGRRRCPGRLHQLCDAEPGIEDALLELAHVVL